MPGPEHPRPPLYDQLHQESRMTPEQKTAWDAAIARQYEIATHPASQARAEEFQRKISRLDPKDWLQEIDI